MSISNVEREVKSPQNPKSGIELLNQDGRDTISISSTRSSRKKGVTTLSLFVLIFNALIGYCIYREVFTDLEDNTFRDTILLSIFQLVGIAFAIIFAFRYYSVTTIMVTKESILLRRKILAGISYRVKRNTKKLVRIKEYLDFSDGEAITGVELCFDGESNLLIGQHLEKLNRQYLIRLIGQVLREAN